MSVQDRLAAALRLTQRVLDDKGGTNAQDWIAAEAAARAALADHVATPKGEVKSNRDWREEVQLLREALTQCVADCNEHHGELARRKVISTAFAALRAES